MRFNKKVGTVDLALGFTGTYLNTEASKRAELYEDSYQNRQGKPLDALWGLKNDGFLEMQMIFKTRLLRLLDKLNQETSNIKIRMAMV